MTLKKEEDQYCIENLVTTFGVHAEMSDAHTQQTIDVFKETCPETEIPEHLKNPFNISRALSVICLEIEKIKKGYK